MKKTNVMYVLAVLMSSMVLSSCAKDIADAIEKGLDKAIEPLTEAQKQAHRDALTYWIINNGTDQEAIDAFGYNNCFTVVDIDDNRFSEDLPAGVQKSDLCEVRTLFLWQEPGNANNSGILVGGVICHKDIANDLRDIFKQLYEAKYPINQMALSLNMPLKTALETDVTFCYSYNSNSPSEISEAHQKGKAVCLNPQNKPKSGDKAVTLFTAKGFTWDGQYTFEKK